jgi:hypothetical protein
VTHAGSLDAEVPLARQQVQPIVEPHLARLAGVLTTAWATFIEVRSEQPDHMAQASAGAKGMLVADFMRQPAHNLFSHVGGVSVDSRYGRPWVNLAGGRVQIRFKKLTPTFEICTSDTERQVKLAFHLGDPALPGMPDATILTAGYILDSSQQGIEQMALVCHLGSTLHYRIPLPDGTTEAPGPVQIPLMPLSPPIIRSARLAARARINSRD